MAPLKDKIRQFARSYRVVGVLLLVYWGCLFAGTHFPKLQLPKLGSMNDKVLHFAAYSILAFLLAALCSIKWRVGFSMLLCVFLMAAAYGLVDELSQIPVPGRQADIRDWCADLLGALTGVVLFAVAYRACDSSCRDVAKLVRLAPLIVRLETDAAFP